MALNAYQNPILILGGIVQDPYHLNILQIPIQVIGTTYTPPLKFTSTGGIELGGSSLLRVGYKFTSTDGVILGGSSLLRMGYKFTSTDGVILGGSSLLRVGYKFISNGGLALSINSISNLNSGVFYQHLMTGTLILESNFINKFNDGSSLNYILSGPRIVNLDFNNIYFNLQIIDSFSGSLSIKIISDKNVEFIFDNEITQQNNNFYLTNFPVGDYELEAVSNSESLKLNGNKLSIKVVSSNSKESLYPKIIFKVDFNINDLNNIQSDYKTISIPILNKTLKHNDIFVLYGNDATYFKNNILPQYKDLIKII